MPSSKKDESSIKSSHSDASKRVPMKQFDPLMLLNPKAGQAASNRSAPASRAAINGAPLASSSSASRLHAPQLHFSFASADGTPDDHSVSSEDLGQSSMLDRMHNLEDRGHDTKRRRLSVSPSREPVRSKTSWTQAGGGGLVSQHIKEKRQELQSAQDHASAVDALRDRIEAALPHRDNTVDLTKDHVDLTATDDRGAGTSAALTAAAAAAVDLTQEAADGERDFYVVNGKKIYYDKNDVDEKEVVYGRIDGARILCHMVPNTGRQISSRAEWPSMAVKLQRHINPHSAVIKAYDPTNRDFGSLDPKTAYALRNFIGSPVYRMRLDARTDSRAKKPYEAPGQPMSDHIVVNINFSGPRKYAEVVGKALMKSSIWLRSPKWLPNGMDYYNPHCNDPEQAKAMKKAQSVLKLPGTNGASSSIRMRTSEEAQGEIQSLFDHLQKNDKLPMLEPDNNIVSELLDHQKQALWWMVEREKPLHYEPGQETPGSLWRCSTKNSRTSWHHIVTGHEFYERPPDTHGGLLADMMGLGKTLELLALLSYTRGDATKFEQQGPDVKHERTGKELMNIKTTLIVCPVSVITNWEDQIIQHVRPGGLKYYAFHGANRRREVDFLKQHDIVLTTYSIVKSELLPASSKRAGTSPFNQVNFFRIVLDEAHTIRTQTTQQFQACVALHAMKRWCLTATPVQNRLDDFGALVKFVRVFPFNVNNTFGQFILSPFKLADPEALKRLRILVDSFTLRRLKDTIDLPPRQDETVMLSFSKHDQQLYKFFTMDANKRMNAMSVNVGGRTKLSGKGYMNILRSILCLRQICAHGADMLSDEDMRLIEGQSSASAIDVEEEETRPALDEAQAYQMFDLLKETNSSLCAGCGKSITAVIPDVPDDEEDTVFCTMLPCYQILCSGCVKQVNGEAKQRIENGEDRMHCPYCSVAWRISLSPITASGMLRAEQRKLDLAREPKKAKIRNRYNGPSAKAIQLVSRLRDSEAESVALEEEGEMPIKSVVFSAWTTHLDLISMALDNENIEYTSLIGSMSRKQRRESLDEFRNSRTCNVFLVSIGTGGVGLNLTAANKVYLMDIGFNPMAEQQAVDRVHRLGQKRQVIFTRFLMHNTIEGKILDMQKKKMDLADLSLQKGKVDRAEAVRARLEELKSLFR